MTNLVARIRDRVNDAPMPSEHLLDEAAELIDCLLVALKAVLRVADRKTIEFDAARAAIAKAEGVQNVH